MANTTVQKTIHEAALELAGYNVESEPTITRIYLFPDEREIRLVIVDPTTLKSKVLSPFYFAASPDENLPYASAVALIQPDEEKELPLPDGWDWNEAVIIWPQANK
jgi:hypothetical protein